MKKIIITVVVLLGVIALGMKGKGLLESRKDEVANTPLPSTETITVPVVSATEGSLTKTLPFLAQIFSDKEISLSTKLSGYIEKIFVTESQHVSKGALLLRIDATELRSSIESLQATLDAQQNDLAVAKSIHERNIKLYDIGGLAKEKLDLSALTLKMKHASIENTLQKIAQLNHQRSYLDIRAPFDGIVDSILLHEGDLAAAGKPILRMHNGIQKLRFSYAPTNERAITAGKTVQHNNRPIGKISTVYTTATNGLVTAEVALDTPLKLPIGSSVTIDVVTHEAQGCIIPDTTVLHKKEGTFVMVYNKDKGTFSPMKIHVNLLQRNRVLVSECPTSPIAQASEVKLAQLPAYNNVTVTGVNNE